MDIKNFSRCCDAIMLYAGRISYYATPPFGKMEKLWRQIMFYEHGTELNVYKVNSTDFPISGNLNFKVDFNSDIVMTCDPAAFDEAMAVKICNHVCQWVKDVENKYIFARGELFYLVIMTYG